MRAKLQELKEELRWRMHSADPRTGALAEASRHCVLRLLRSAGQRRGAARLPLSCDVPVATQPAAPSGGRTLLAQNAVQPKLGRAHHVGRVPPDQTAATDLATKAVPCLSGVTSSAVL
jgi:hypothetical protein